MSGSNSIAANCLVDRPVKVGDFVTTIYKALDIDHEQEVVVNGRPVKLTDNAQPVNELFL